MEEVGVLWITSTDLRIEYNYYDGIMFTNAAKQEDSMVRSNMETGDVTKAKALNAVIDDTHCSSLSSSKDSTVQYEVIQNAMTFTNDVNYNCRAIRNFSGRSVDHNNSR